jgi:hypothetical protein
MNPVIGHIDAILSVGPQEARVLSLCPGGQYPGLVNIVNTLMEGFYKLSTDQAEESITRLNSLILLSHSLEKLEERKALPPLELERIRKEVRGLTRMTFLSCRLVRPLTPFSLTATGYEETINRGLWDAGICAVDKVLEQETGEHHIPRTLFA